MLKDVLKEISKSNIFSKSTISKNLNISELMVEELVNQLIRMGYLEEDLGSPTCESKCSGCHITSCNLIPIKMFSVTEKGKNLLKN